jgi:hypothetical protein
MLHRVSVLTIACVATALGGCDATYPTYVMAPPPPPLSGTPSKATAVEASELSLANKPRRRPRAASRATAARRDSAQTTSEAAPSQHPYYSPEWWNEQERQDKPLKRALNNICRGC